MKFKRRDRVVLKGEPSDVGTVLETDEGGTGWPFLVRWDDQAAPEHWYDADELEPYDAQA